MLKFIRGKGQQPTNERQRLHKELYGLRKTVQHGFPHKPTALAYDPKHRLMAIATHSGVIKVFGQPGVEFYGQNHNLPQSESTVQLLEWVVGSGRLLSLTVNNILTLWEPAAAVMVPIKSMSLEGKLKKISALCCSLAKDTVWIGTEGGLIYQFDLTAFQLKAPIISHDIITNQLPSFFHHTPGAVECVRQLPNKYNHLLVAFNRGLCILWDTKEGCVLKSYVSPGHGQSVGLYVEPEGDKFTWYHADGSYAMWYIDNAEVPDDEKYVPYGPDPCKAINRLVRGFRGDDEIVIFSGGMPRSAYGDHQCVSVHCKDGSKVALDFTSKVIDFFVVFDEEEIDQAQVLVVLLEEELVSYDLTNKELPLLMQPYLHSVHASAMTCNYLASDVFEDVFLKIKNAGSNQFESYSKMEWPINGGSLEDDLMENEPKLTNNILITGHEDGSVKFWDCSNINLTPLLQVNTALIFRCGDDDVLGNNMHSTEVFEEGEPPFRKAGQFDPYSDDPRLAIKKIALCPKTGTLAVGGTAGNVVIYNFDVASKREPIKVTFANLVSDRDGFVWKGHDQLKIKPELMQEYVQIQDGIEVASVLQISPPAAITCIAVQSIWGLVAAGTAHGLVLHDFENNMPVLHKCTLNPNDLTGAGEPLSRKKSFKKTLRESFRRLRKGRSTRNINNQPSNPQAESRPMERQIEARPVDDGMGSMVRCLTFAFTFVTNATTPVASLWSGTNSSCVSVFVIYLSPSTPDNANRKPTTGQLAKEIQLKHRAPIIGITHYDNAVVPLEFQHEQVNGPHKVLIASEEQFKVFSLPYLKPVTKYKLTAHEGARVRKIQFATFSCKINPVALQNNPDKAATFTASPPPTRVASAVNNQNNKDVAAALASQVEHAEIGLICLTNLGDCMVLSIPELKRHTTAPTIRREDINGISSLCFTTCGEGLYMMSSSEIQRITLTPGKTMTARGTVELDLLEENVTDEEQDFIENSKSSGNVSTIEISSPNDSKRAESQELKTESTTHFNAANETILSGDLSVMTIDSVKDHLNTTETIICTQTTEEIVGRLSVLSTNTINQLSVANSKDIIDLNTSNLKDLKEIGDTIETSSKSTVIKSVITTVSADNSSKEREINSTTVTNRKESQF